MLLAESTVLKRNNCMERLSSVAYRVLLRHRKIIQQNVLKHGFSSFRKKKSVSETNMTNHTSTLYGYRVTRQHNGTKRKHIQNDTIAYLIVAEEEMIPWTGQDAEMK